MKKIIVKKRHSIRKSQGQDLLARLTEQIGASAKLFPADMIEVLETNADVSLFMVNKKPLLMDTGDWVFPTLKGAVQIPFPERRVTVDAGAIPYVVNGADVMRPGIVAVTDDVKAGARSRSSTSGTANRSRSGSRCSTGPRFVQVRQERWSKISITSVMRSGTLRSEPDFRDHTVREMCGFSPFLPFTVQNCRLTLSK